MVVQHGGQQVVGCADGVKIAGEVEVNVLHGDNLGVAAAGRAALNAEHRAERRLPKRQHHPLAHEVQRVGQAHAGGGLALSRGRGVNGGDQNQLALAGRAPQRGYVHLGLGASVRLQQVLVKIQL
ncbi:hypothetical protein SDC9_164823 [bioreactor metagenome]|uniref:Uncharacterized protein n=1 Tax=bioreactor metagenome TaxID=1076179 RepID=A0A645FUN8_9ZZZZ